MKIKVISLATNTIIYEGENEETAYKIKNDLQGFANLVIIRE